MVRKIINKIWRVCKGEKRANTICLISSSVLSPSLVLTHEAKAILIFKISYNSVRMYYIFGTWEIGFPSWRNWLVSTDMTRASCIWEKQSVFYIRSSENKLGDQSLLKSTISAEQSQPSSLTCLPYLGERQLRYRDKGGILKEDRGWE